MGCSEVDFNPLRPALTKFRPKIGRKEGVVLKYILNSEEQCYMCGMGDHVLSFKVTRARVELSCICRLNGRHVEKFGELVETKKNITGFYGAQDKKAKTQFTARAIQHAREDVKKEGDWEYSPWDPYTFSDFIKEVGQHEGTDLEDLMGFIATRINRVIAYIPPDEYVVKKSTDSEPFHLVKKVPTFTGRYMKFHNGKAKITELPASKVLVELIARDTLHLYQGKDCDPSRTVPETIFNMWPGYIIEHQNVINHTVPASFDVFMDFLENWICQSDKSVFQAFMKCFVETIRHPHKKLAWSVVMYSPGKRVGKTLLWTFLSSFVFGNLTMKKFNGLNELLHTHNGWVVGKKLVVVEECSTTQSQFRIVWDQLKSFITDSKVSVNPKFINQFDTTNYTWLWLVTNHLYALSLEEDDRRYLVIQPKDTADKKGYLKKVAKQILNWETGKAFYDHCMDCGTLYDDWDPYNENPPITEPKQTIMDNCQSMEGKFLTELYCIWLNDQLKRKLEELQMTQLEKDLPEHKHANWHELELAIEFLQSTVEQIGDPNDVDGTEEVQLVGFLRAELKDTGEISTPALFKCFSKWFDTRLSNGDSKAEKPRSLNGKAQFGKKISTYLDKAETKARTKLGGRVQVWQLDSIRAEVVGLENLARIRDVLHQTPLQILASKR